MARYFFNVRDRFGLATDPDGREFADLDAVRRAAIVGARSLICDDIQHGRLDLTGELEILDQDGTIVLVLPFGDAVRQED
jgi:hypothetical protein